MRGEPPSSARLACSLHSDLDQDSWGPADVAPACLQGAGIPPASLVSPSPVWLGGAAEESRSSRPRQVAFCPQRRGWRGTRGKPKQALRGDSAGTPPPTVRLPGHSCGRVPSVRQSACALAPSPASSSSSTSARLGASANPRRALAGGARLLKRPPPPSPGLPSLAAALPRPPRAPPPLPSLASPSRSQQPLPRKQRPRQLPVLPGRPSSPAARLPARVNVKPEEPATAAGISWRRGVPFARSPRAPAGDGAARSPLADREGGGGEGTSPLPSLGLKAGAALRSPRLQRRRIQHWDSSQVRHRLRRPSFVRALSGAWVGNSSAFPERDSPRPAPPVESRREARRIRIPPSPPPPLGNGFSAPAFETGTAEERAEKRF